MLRIISALSVLVIFSAAPVPLVTEAAAQGVTYHEVWDTCRGDSECNRLCGLYADNSRLEYTRGGDDPLPPNNKYHAWRACALTAFDECVTLKEANDETERACLNEFSLGGGDGVRMPGD